MLAVIDYGSGNLKSVSKAFVKAMQDCGYKEQVLVTKNPVDLYLADRIVLPGVGAFGDCMAGLDGILGMKDAVREAVIIEKKPFLGICVGMQLMADIGLENGRHAGLSWIDGEVIPLPKAGWKVPHMGWNSVTFTKPHPVFRGIPEKTDFYFVHSYHFKCRIKGQCLATTEYSAPLCAAVGKDNIVGVQFHPEKSQLQGLRVLVNFLSWRP